jgi:hypothetical protein
MSKRFWQENLERRYRFSRELRTLLWKYRDVKDEDIIWTLDAASNDLRRKSTRIAGDANSAAESPSSKRTLVQNP